MSFSSLAADFVTGNKIPCSAKPGKSFSASCARQFLVKGSVVSSAKFMRLARGRCTNCLPKSKAGANFRDRV